MACNASNGRKKQSPDVILAGLVPSLSFATLLGEYYICSHPASIRQFSKLILSSDAYITPEFLCSIPSTTSCVESVDILQYVYVIAKKF